MVKKLPAMQETWVRSLGWENPWEREWQPTPVSGLENSINIGAWRVIVHGAAKSQTLLSK